jgi:hypothetical protein
MSCKKIKRIILVTLIFTLVVNLIINSNIYSASTEANETKLYNLGNSYTYFVININKLLPSKLLKIEIDNNKIDNYNYSTIKTDKSKISNIILLIQNVKDNKVDNYDNLVKESLLNFRKSLPENINVFSYKYSDELKEVNFWESDLFTSDYYNKKLCRLNDFLTVVTSKYDLYNKDTFLIINIGSGKNIGSISKKYLPGCPIIFVTLNPESNINSEISTLSEISNGFTIKDLSNFNYSYIMQRLNDINKISRYVVVLQNNNFLKLKKNHQVKFYFENSEYKVLYQVSIIKNIVIFSFIILLTLFFILMFYFNRRKTATFKNNNNFSAKLEIVKEYDRKLINVNKNFFTVGSSNICDLIIDDFEVSAFHCIIKRKGTFYEIIDNNSRNGVYLNSGKINKKMLANGDLIRLGSTILIFKIFENAN